MVIIMITLPKHQPVNLKKVFGGIISFVTDMPVFMRKPVNDHAMYRAHGNVQGQYEQEPERGCKYNI